jgi:hypothetical protein
MGGHQAGTGCLLHASPAGLRPQPYRCAPWYPVRLKLRHGNTPPPLPPPPPPRAVG